jgi:antitoxin HicB
MRYTIVLDPDPEEGGYTVTVPALPGCITEGDSVQEATERAKEAIRAWLAAAVADGEEIPIEEPPVLVSSVEVDPPVVAAAAD